MTTAVGRRARAFGACVFVAVATTFVLGVAPASAHATLLTTEPAPGTVLDAAPQAITLRFNEPVESSLGSVRVFDGDAHRVVAGAPHHPAGDHSVVRSSLPDLDGGTYVVTWRVVSADSHPVDGSFTFQIGPDATTCDAGALARRLLADQGGSELLGVVYAVDRGLLYASVALLIGGAAFLVVVLPSARRRRRARRAVWAGWIGVVVTTVAGIALEGAYAQALPASKVLDPTVFGDVLGTRFGHVSIGRLVVLALMLPLLRVLLPPSSADGERAADRHVPRWWPAAGGVLAVALALTIGLAGHPSTGRWTAAAIPADMLHVLAMSLWLGGIVLLLLVVLPSRDPDELRTATTRFSSLALGAIAVLVISGAFQGYRQVGSLDALRDTDYGRLLIIKLLVFAALLVAAAFSREVVNRRYRTEPYDSEREPVEDAADERVEDRVAVGVGGPLVTGPPDAGRSGGSGAGGADPGDEAAGDGELRRLRRSVVAEVVFAAVILGVTSLLVNTAPALRQETKPVALTLESKQLLVDVTIAPGAAGPNDIHITSVPTPGGLTTVDDMTLQLQRPGGGLAPFDVPLRRLGPGHYYAPLFDIPYPGRWEMIVRARIGPTEQVALVGRFTLR